MGMTAKFNKCVKSVRKTVRARKGSTKESAAIAICTASVLQKRGRTMKRYTRKRLITQKKKGAAKSTMSGLFSGKMDPLYAPGSTFTPGTIAKAKNAETQLNSKKWEEKFNAEKVKYSKELELQGVQSWEDEYKRELNSHMSNWVTNNPKVPL
jgi:hypothetical protein